MDTYLAIASKRDWRRYADRPVPEEVSHRILDAGRLAGSAVNRQPWTFVIVESDEARGELAEVVYVADNVRTAGLVVAVVTAGNAPFDAGRAAQNMMLVAWSDGVVSCPNGFTDADRAAEVLGLGSEEKLVNAISFGYPARPLDPETRSPEEWSREAKRKPLDEIVRRV